MPKRVRTFATKSQYDLSKASKIEYKFGFIIDAKKHPLLFPQDFDFFNVQEYDEFFLCLDDSKVQPQDVVCPFIIKKPLEFIALCNKETFDVDYKIEFNWLHALKWLLAKDCVLNHFKKNLIQNYDAWKHFKLLSPNPQKEYLLKDEEYAIDHGFGEEFIDPIKLSCNDFAKRVNIPLLLVMLVREVKAIISGGACLDFGLQPSSDVDIFILDNQLTTENVESLSTELRKTHHILKLSQSVYTCVAFLPTEKPFRNIQLVSSNAKTPLDVLRGFDVDCVKLYYDGSYLFKTRLCQYALSHMVCSYPRDTLILNAKRLVKYFIKGFNLTQKEIDCIKHTLGEWPLSSVTIQKFKFDYPSFNPMLNLDEQHAQWLKYGLEPADENDLLVPFESYYKVEIEPNPFHGSMEEYVKLLQIKGDLRFANIECDYSIQLQNVTAVIFNNYPQNFYYSDGTIVPSTNLIYPKTPSKFKMQTSSHLMNYTHLHNAIIAKAQKDLALEAPRLRSGKQYNNLKQKETTFLNNKFQDIIVYFWGCKVYCKGRFLQNGMEGVLLNAKMHIIAIPTALSVGGNVISWCAKQAFLI